MAKKVAFLSKGGPTLIALEGAFAYGENEREKYVRTKL